MNSNTNAAHTTKETDFFQEATITASAGANLANTVNLEAFEPKIADKSSEGPNVAAALSMANTDQTSSTTSNPIKSNILGQKKIIQTKKVSPKKLMIRFY